MSKPIFKTIKIRDPRTDEIKVLTPEDQEKLINAGVFIPTKWIIEDEEEEL